MAEAGVVACEAARLLAAGADAAALRGWTERQLDDPARAVGLGAAFGLLARRHASLARDLEPRLFGAERPPTAWWAFLLWSNPVLPAAAMLAPRYAAHIDGVAGDDSTPIVFDIRCGLHVLLLACFVPEAVPSASELSERFVATARLPVLEPALRAAHVAVCEAVEAEPIVRLDALLLASIEGEGPRSDRARWLQSFRQRVAAVGWGAGR